MARRLSTILKDAFTADKITEDLWFEFFNVCGNAWVEFLTHPAQPGQTVGPPVALNVDGHEDPHGHRVLVQGCTGRRSRPPDTL